MMFDECLKAGWIFEIDYTEYDGYRVSARIPPTYEETGVGFWSHDSLEQAIEHAITETRGQEA